MQAFNYLCLKHVITMGKFINPFSDWGFKRIFGQDVNKELLIAFLNNLLEGERRITDLTFKDKEQLGDTQKSRNLIYDVYCTTDTGEHIIVEIQNRWQEHFVDRSLYYSSKAIVGQGKKGEWDYKLNAVYCVCFMQFTTRELERKFRTDISLMDMETHRPLSDKLRLIYLMLPFFNKEEDECENDFERWIFVLKNMNTFERMPFLAQDAVFRKLAEITDIYALSKEEQEKYDESIKAMRDAIATYKGALKEGEEIGMAKGMKKGHAEGRAEGIRQNQIATAINLKQAGVPLETIAQCTGLSIQEVESL